MSLWNKILIGLIIATTLPFYFFAARAMKTHFVWRESIRKHNEAIARVKDENRVLLWGDESDESNKKKGIEQFESEIHKLTLIRGGRVWRNTQALQVDQATGACTVQTQLPRPHSDALKAQLFVFVQGDAQNPAAYLGDFNLVAVGDKGWQLQPTRTMYPREKARLQQTMRTPWIMYETMPRTDPEFLAKLGEAPGAKPDGKAFDQVCDFQQLFDNFYAQRTKLLDMIESVTMDLKAVNDALTLAKQEVDHLNSDVKKFKEELAEVTRHRDALVAHRKVVDDKLAQLEAAIDATIKANRAAAGELARLQSQAKEQIDARTNRMAQAGIGLQP